MNVSANESFNFTIDNGNPLFIDWGDSSNDTYSGNVLANHSYSAANIYNVSIKGNASRIAFGGAGDETPNLLYDILNNISIATIILHIFQEIDRFLYKILEFRVSLLESKQLRYTSAN